MFPELSPGSRGAALNDAPGRSADTCSGGQAPGPRAPSASDEATGC